MLTQEYLVGDLELRLSKSKPSEDLDLSYEQMAYWVDVARDEVTKEIVRADKKIHDSLIMKIEGITPTLVGGSMMLDMDIIPLDLKNKSGVVSVYNEFGEYINGQNRENSKRNSRMAFTKPSICNIVYTITGSSIVLDAGDSDIDESVTYNVLVVPSEVSRTKDPDDLYYATPSSLSAILEMAEEIGLRELTGRGFYDITDDGIGNDIE